MTSPLDTYCTVLETLNATNLPALEEAVAKDVVFRDPFHEVTGTQAMSSIFEKMFASLAPVRFAVTDRCEADGFGMIRWTFTARFRGKSFSFTGMSHLEWNAEGQITRHEDFWDAASGFYEHVPVIGSLMRALRRRVSD